MTAAKRRTPTVSNGDSRVGTDVLDANNREVAALWTVAKTWLPTIGGSANAITATSDTAFVAAITAYARGQRFVFTPASANTSALTINIDGVGVVAIKDKFGAAFQGGEFSTSGSYEIEHNGTLFLALNMVAGSASSVSTAPDIIVQDQKTSGTSGGTHTSGSYQQRVLNTFVRNLNTLGTLASNQLTLPAGTYYIEWDAPSQKTNSHMSRLYNVTDSTVVGYGKSQGSDSLNNSRSSGSIVVTITSAKAFQIDHRCQTTRVTDGLGLACSFGNIETFAEMKVWKQ